MSNSIIVRGMLDQSIDELASSPSLFAVNPGKDFTRNRKLSFKDTLQLMLTMEGDCIQEEIYRFFGRNIDAPTKAAFCRQRDKISEKALPTLMKMFNSRLPVSLYKGKYRIFACDGSSAGIARDPNDGTTFFEPSKASSTGFNMIYINALYSILDNRFENFVVQPGRMMNEFTAFCHLVDDVGKTDPPIIYIGDMGYASYNNFAHVIENDQYFMIRANDRILWSILDRSVDDLRELDCRVDLALARSSAARKLLVPYDDYRFKKLSYCVAFDYFRKDVPLYHMSLRVVRFEIKDGVFENIVTNLPDLEFDFEDFKDLYHLRWNEETSFRNMKHPLCLTAFHSKKYRNVVQEIWARAILHNFSTAIISTVLIGRKGTVHEYQVNYSEAFKTCREFLRTRSPDILMNVTGLIARTLEPIRPERSFARQHRIKLKRPFSFWYRN